MSCHVLLHVQLHHARIARHMHTSTPATLIIRGAPESTYGCDIHASQTIFNKINCLTF